MKWYFPYKWVSDWTYKQFLFEISYKESQFFIFQKNSRENFFHRLLQTPIQNEVAFKSAHSDSKSNKRNYPFSGLTAHPPAILTRQRKKQTNNSARLWKMAAAILLRNKKENNSFSKRAVTWHAEKRTQLEHFLPFKLYPFKFIDVKRVEKYFFSFVFLVEFNRSGKNKMKTSIRAWI